MVIMPIEMPTGCGDCPCNSESYCSLLDDPSLPVKYAYSTNKRDPRCPLIDDKEYREEIRMS